MRPRGIIANYYYYHSVVQNYLVIKCLLKSLVDIDIFS